MRQPKNSAGGGIPSEPDAYEVIRGILPLWDMSSEPSNNEDFEKKLGKADHIRGGAIVRLEKTSNRNTVADGIINRRKIPSIMQMDPDSWVLRLYKTKGGAYVGTWNVRLSVDHTAADDTMGNRGTMVIDQNTDQQWAWLGDALRITAPKGGSRIADREIMFTHAGYLELLHEKSPQVPSVKRGALAINFARNVGFISDGTRVGQLSHVLCWPSNATPTPGGGGGRSTIPANRPKPVAIAEETAEVFLRGDAGFSFLEGNGRFDMKAPPSAPDEGKDKEIRLVQLYLDIAGKPDDSIRNTAEDNNSNHQKIPKTEAKKIIKGWVRVPKGSSTTTKYDYSYHNPPPWNPASGSSGSSSGSEVSTTTGEGASVPPNGGTNPDGLPAAGEPVPTVDPQTQDKKAHTYGCTYGYDGSID